MLFLDTIATIFVSTVSEGDFKLYRSCSLSPALHFDYHHLWRRSKVLSSIDNSGEDCKVFVSPDGTVQEVMCCDYGFRSGFGRLYQGGDGEIPKNFFALVRNASLPSACFLLRHAHHHHDLDLRRAAEHAAHSMWLCAAQGADNFRKEFKQLRRSFRFNEYKEIRAQNPPTNPVSRVTFPLHHQAPSPVQSTHLTHYSHLP